MKLKKVKITDFRNLEIVEFSPNSEFNLIYGDNGSGKTSLLEAIYMFGHGRSFRTHLGKRIIRHDADQLTLYGEACDMDSERPIGILRDRSGQTIMRLSGETVPSIAELAKLLPIQLINPQSYTLLDSGPKFRRQFLDWGMFHVEHRYFSIWQRFQRLLKQRNAALRIAANIDQIQIWDNEYVELAGQIDRYRQNYVERLIPLFREIFADLLAIDELDIQYRRGWDRERDLLEVLAQSINADVKVGYSQHGPQRADLNFKVNKVPVHDELSRGQQKLLVCALKLAQGKLLYNMAEKQCIYLIDDLPAELDSHHLQNMYKVLQQINSQVFLTSLSKDNFADLIDNVANSMFHVERGKFTRQCQS